MSKPGKVLKGLCKKLGVRLTVKRGKKRIYKSVALLKRQCANKKKKRKVKKKVKRKRRRKFGSDSQETQRQEAGNNTPQSIIANNSMDFEHHWQSLGDESSAPPSGFEDEHLPVTQGSLDLDNNNTPQSFQSEQSQQSYNSDFEEAQLPFSPSPDNNNNNNIKDLDEESKRKRELEKKRPRDPDGASSRPNSKRFKKTMEQAHVKKLINKKKEMEQKIQQAQEDYMNSSDELFHYIDGYYRPRGSQSVIYRFNSIDNSNRIHLQRVVGNAFSDNPTFIDISIDDLFRSFERVDGYYQPRGSQSVIYQFNSIDNSNRIHLHRVGGNTSSNNPNIIRISIDDLFNDFERVPVPNTRSFGRKRKKAKRKRKKAKRKFGRQVAKRSNEKLWRRIQQKYYKSNKGGKPGQWSARKAQLAVQEYKKKGGKYVGNNRKKTDLHKWTKEDWGTRSGKNSIQGKKATGERYLPRKAREALTKKEYKRTTAAKRRGIKKGKQFVRQPKKIAKKTAKYRRRKKVKKKKVKIKRKK
tara:strand:- start:895 stop:2466 length:1572 start_codon:yes stop_codon:yes gene_type:complete